MRRPAAFAWLRALPALAAGVGLSAFAGGAPAAPAASDTSDSAPSDEAKTDAPPTSDDASPDAGSGAEASDTADEAPPATLPEAPPRARALRAELFEKYPDLGATATIALRQQLSSDEATSAAWLALRAALGARDAEAIEKALLPLVRERPPEVVRTTLAAAILDRYLEVHEPAVGARTDGAEPKRRERNGVFGDLEDADTLVTHAAYGGDRRTATAERRMTRR